nr:odorant receptor [Semanotus bifasciatus]
MSSWESLGISLKMSNMCGLHPQKPIKPFFVFNFIMLTIITVLIIMNVIYNFHLTLLESISYIYYVWAKFFFILCLQRRPLEGMLALIKHFKPIDDDFSKENIIYKRYDGWLKLYAFYTVFCAFFMIYNATTLDRWTIYESYAPKGVPELVLFMAELYVIILTYFSIMGGNILACTLMLSVAQQFGILQRQLHGLDLVRMKTDGDRQICIKNLNEIIAYHIFLVKCIKNLREIYSLPLLMQIIGDVAVLCINMYGMTLDTGIMDLGRHIALNLLVLASFVFLFGYPSQILTEQSEGVGYTVYCICQWYLPNIIPIRKDLQLMLLMSQKTLTITAGGFTDVNNRTVLVLMKTAYSFFAYLQTVS